MTKPRIQFGLIVILAIIALLLLLSLKANPDTPPLFALKRAQEKVFLKAKSTPTDQVDYMISLLESRLRELQNVVGNKSYDAVLKASLRYSTLAGQITDLIIANNLTDKAASVRDQFLSHQKILDALYVAYPKNIPENEEWKYIVDDFNYLGLYLDKLKEVKF